MSRSELLLGQYDMFNLSQIGDLARALIVGESSEGRAAGRCVEPTTAPFISRSESTNVRFVASAFPRTGAETDIRKFARANGVSLL